MGLKGVIFKEMEILLKEVSASTWKPFQESHLALENTIGNQQQITVSIKKHTNVMVQCSISFLCHILLN